MKQIFLASTFFELVCLAAGIDSGAYDTRVLPAVLRTPGEEPARDPLDISERILLASNNALVIEQATGLADTPGAETLLERFDRVLVLNDLIAPQHPSSWSPAERDLPMFERLIRKEWDLGAEEVELVLESPQVNPAIALSRVFSDAFIRVHADGLMSYGPTRSRIPLGMGQRLTELHCLPLVEGLRPLLLREYGIHPGFVPGSAFTAVDDELAAALDDEVAALVGDLDGADTAFAVGQYLSALGLITFEEEEALHLEMIEKAARSGCTAVVFKPHPAAPHSARAVLEAAAASHGIALTVIDSPIITEVLLHRLQPRLMIGVFSTALATARAIYGIETATVGTELLLDRIAPYQNSNRVPLTIIDRLDRTGAAELSAAQAAELQSLVEAVAYCMQPIIAQDLRPVAQNVLALTAGTPEMRYFKKRRLMKLGLPGGLRPTRNPKTIARRLGGVGLRLGRQRLRSRLPGSRERS